MTRKNRGWKNEPTRHACSSKGIKTTVQGRTKGIDEIKAEYDGRPDALENKIEELITEEGLNNYEAVEWLKEHNLLDEAKHTEFWDVIMDENPRLTEETLEAFLDTDEGQEYIENHFEAMHEIPWNGAVKGNPYWLENVESPDRSRDLISLTDDDVITHQLGFSAPPGQNGGTVDGSVLKQKYGDAFDEDKEYKYIGGTKGSSELEFQAEDGGLVYKHVGSNFFNAYRPVEE